MEEIKKEQPDEVNTAEGSVSQETKVIPDLSEAPSQPEIQQDPDNGMNADETEVTDVRPDIRVEDLEDKITASTVVTASHPAPEDDGYDDYDESYDDDEDEEEVPEDRAQRRKRNVRITAILLLGLVLIIGGVYLGMAWYFNGHFFSGTRINGQDVSGMTVENAKKTITREITNYKLTIRGRDDVTEVISAEDIGLTYVDDGAVERLMDGQVPWKWFLSPAMSKIYDINADTTYDQDKLAEAVDGLTFMQEDNIIEPQDAVLVETAEGASITPEVPGTRVDRDKLIAAVTAAVETMADSIDMTEPDIYVSPAILSDDESLNRRMEEWNAYLTLEISYRFGDNVETVSKEQIASGLKDDGKEVTVDTTWARDIVGEWADKYNTFGRERTFKTHNGTMVTLPAYTLDTGELDPKTKEELTHTSDYGWLLNSDATAEDLASAILNRESGEREPIFKYKARGWDNGDLTGTYVEISLKEQHMWVYVDYELVVDTEVVTGLPVSDRATYTGCYAIDAMKSPATLGTIATQGYSTQVQFWAPFDGGRGLHDAKWRTVFGGTEYESNGSHGCVNTPPDKMAKVYENIVIGEAVCVY